MMYCWPLWPAPVPTLDNLLQGPEIGNISNQLAASVFNVDYVQDNAAKSV